MIKPEQKYLTNPLKTKPKLPFDNRKVTANDRKMFGKNKPANKDHPKSRLSKGLSKDHPKSRFSKDQGKRIKRKPLPIIFIQSTLNNTILTLTDKKGNPLASSSAGRHGFKNARKKNSFAAQVSSTHLAKICIDKRIKMLEVRMKGLGKGKRSALTALKKAGLKIKRLVELTPVPFNGCRPPKKRRI